MSSINTLMQIFVEPGKAMEAVRERSMVLLPLLLMVLGTAAMQFWYYSVVDFPWLQDYLLNADPNMEPAMREQARGFMTQQMVMGGAVISVMIILPLMLVLTAVYYLLAAKVVGNEFGFGKWFAFATWSSVPTLLLLPLMALQILTMSNGQLHPEALNPVSLNQLLFHLPASNPWAGLLGTLNLTTFWAWAVGIIGYQRWTGKSFAASSFIVLLPSILIFGGWALFAAMKSAA